ncbi:MAG: ferritin-like domain-containing protein [Alphaproteobacteria bacterium]|nr:ferritin-like domain-containing protein [Alphaproteobacteria bacterium]
MKTMNELLVHFVRDMYYAERQILKALPKMARAAQAEELKQALTEHREQTEHHVERLQQVFEALGERARGVTCEAIVGLIGEGEEIVQATEPGPVRDAGLIGCAQAVEHYEIARYGMLLAWAKACGAKEAVGPLEQTLAEEKKADALLNELATRRVNPQATQRAA